MLKTLAVVGTRPDALKMAPVILELQRRPESFSLFVVSTGQHREMLDQVLDVFGIEPQIELSVMRERQTLAGLTQRLLEGLDAVISTIKPDIVLAQGDTTTTFVASLAAFYNKVLFGHVEAGLRTGNKYDPFPEEMNRRLAGAMADLHFAPTEQAKRNLLTCGIAESDIYVTGNTVIDALLDVQQRPFKFEDNSLEELFHRAEKVVLLTTHRRENWGAPMKSICEAVRKIPERFNGVEVVFPVHKNPAVREIVYPELQGKPGITLIEPPDYVPFVHLMKRSYLILTDSGGVQEEAPSLGKPVLVLRKTTERPEGVEAGVAKLVGTDKEIILEEVEELLNNPDSYAKMASIANPYGDGKAAIRICDILIDRAGKPERFKCQ